MPRGTARASMVLGVPCSPNVHNSNDLPAEDRRHPVWQAGCSTRAWGYCMSRQLVMKTFWGRGAVVVALVLLAAVGFCTFEGDHDGDQHAGPVHICLAMLESGLVRIPVIELLIIGSAVILSSSGVTAVTLGVPVPPPKLAVSL
jgi:hypothetical protein